MKVLRWGMALAVLAPMLASAQETPRLSLAERQARSVHLFYPAPTADAYYQEITVEESHPGSYFMACGFRHGYFGIQEMSRPNQPRRVLFSVWDASRGDDPEAVDAEQRVRVLGQGEGVTIRRFGGEGTGGQSFFFYDWAPGETCRFLVTVEVNGNRSAYAAYFYLNDQQRWKHIATFDTVTGGDRLDGLYSFIEDFRRDGASAREVRRARFGNGWARVAGGDWQPLMEARFTADQTPSDNIDASAVEGGYVLATGGDVVNRIPLRSMLNREDNPGNPPELPAESTPNPVGTEPQISGSE